MLHNMDKILYGVVVQDSQGIFVAGLTSYFQYMLDPTLIEVLSLQEVLTWLSDHDWAVIDIEMDFKVYVSTLQLREDNISEFGQVIRDCTRTLSSKPSQNLSWVRRHAAHNFTRIAVLCYMLNQYEPPNYF